MYLKPGFEKEYEKRHAALWPELKKQISESGVKNYSIFWDKDTNILFGYQEVEGESNSQDAEAADEITRKWWDYMADIMEVNPDNSPVTVPLREVFHLDWSYSSKGKWLDMLWLWDLTAKGIKVMGEGDCENLLIKVGSIENKKIKKLN